MLSFQSFVSSQFLVDSNHMTIPFQNPFPFVFIAKGFNSGKPLKLNFKFGFFLLSVKFMIAPIITTAINIVHCQNFIASVKISSILLSSIICVFIQCRLELFLLLLIFFCLPYVWLLVLLCFHQSTEPHNLLDTLV